MIKKEKMNICRIITCPGRKRPSRPKNGQHIANCLKHINKGSGSMFVRQLDQGKP